MFKNVRNRSGNILLQILVATAVMGTSFYFLTTYVIGQKEQVGKTANLVNLRFVLNSAMDFAIFGIRQKYCFTNDDMLLNDTPDKCNLQHTGSVERLIMSNDQENFIRQLIASGQNVGPVDVNNISLKKIERYVKVASASASHPLFPVLQSLRLVKKDDGSLIEVDGISVVASRDESVYLPHAGREVYLNVTVALHSKKGSEPIVIGRTPLTLKSQLVIYPREVGSFALLVPGDLHLDKAWDESMAAGDVSLHKFASRSEVGKSPGLVFLSPVFVNKNVHLPYDGSAGKANTVLNYSAVTFADRLYMGNGWIMSNGALFSPASVGGVNDRYWADSRTFGGFLKGIENDGGLDKGLEVFKGGPGTLSTGISDSMALMKRCIELTQMRASRDNLYKSELAGTLAKNAGTDDFLYRLFLTRGNEFDRQWNQLLVNDDNWDGGQVKLDKDDRLKGGAVINLKFMVGDKFVEVQLPRNGDVRLVAPVGSESYRLSLENIKKAAQIKYDAAVDKLDDLNKDLTMARFDLKKAEDQLDDEMKKPLKPAKDPDPKVDYRDLGLVASLEDKIDDLKAQIAKLTGTTIPDQNALINAASKALDVAKNNYSEYQTKVAHPPVIDISTSRVKNGRNIDSPDKLNISFNFSNVESFLDEKGNLVSPKVGILAYDGSYFKSNPITNPPNTNLQGYLNFEFSADNKSLVAPATPSRTLKSSGLATTEDGTDYGDLEAACEAARNAQTSQSFGGAGWNSDFSASTRLSWNFAGGSTAGKDPTLDTLILSGLNRSNASFQIRSIVGQCVIEASTDFVTGFFSCDSLEIRERTTPLRIIGSFIVGKMKIHPSAFKAGIVWSSIYTAQATRELRDAKVLRSFSGRDCNLKTAEPIWHPIPSVQEVSDRMGCNAISLRAKADPFQWTSVDPDCGVLPGSTSSNTTCKRRLIRFFVVEQSRESSL